MDYIYFYLDCLLHRAQFKAVDCKVRLWTGVGAYTGERTCYVIERYSASAEKWQWEDNADVMPLRARRCTEAEIARIKAVCL